MRPKIYLVYSEVLLKKKKKNKRKISVMTWEKNYKENENLLENSHLKLTISSFR